MHQRKGRNMWAIVPPKSVCGGNQLGDDGIKCQAPICFEVHVSGSECVTMCMEHFITHMLLQTFPTVPADELYVGDVYIQVGWPNLLLRVCSPGKACDLYGIVDRIDFRGVHVKLPQPRIEAFSVLPFGFLADGEPFEHVVDGLARWCVKRGDVGEYVKDRRPGPLASVQIDPEYLVTVLGGQPMKQSEPAGEPAERSAGVKVEKGPRRQFSTGASRQNAKGKGTPVLVCPWAYEELAKHFEDGAEVHEPRNWEKGIPVSELINSAERHLIGIKKGLTDENHYRAFAWNAFVLLGTVARIRDGVLPESLNDLPKYKKVEGQ